VRIIINGRSQLRSAPLHSIFGSFRSFSRSAHVLRYPHKFTGWKLQQTSIRWGLVTPLEVCRAMFASGVTVGGRTAPGDTLKGVTPEWKKLWLNLKRTVEKRSRTGKKVRGDTLERGGGDTRVKSVISKRKVVIFKKKGWHRQLPPRVTPTVTPLMFARMKHK